MNLVSRAKDSLQSPTFQETLQTFSSTFINGLLGLGFYVISARVLGPVDFGLMIIAITTLTLLADVLDLGTNTGLVKFVSVHIDRDSTKAYSFLKISLLIKIIMGVVIGGLGIILAPIIAELVFKKSELTDPLRLAMVGVLGALLITYSTSTLQALERFRAWSWINIFSNSTRLIMVLILVSTGLFNIQSSLLIYITIPMCGFFLASFLLPVKSIITARVTTDDVHKLFKYNGWVALFTLFAALSSRLDTFMVARFLSPREIGFYSASNQLVTVLPQLVSALGIVMAPKFARFSSFDEMWVYLKKTQGLVLLISLLLLFFLPLTPLVISLFYGTNYLPTVNVLIILVLSMLIFLISAPVHNAIFYFFAKPQLFVYLALIHLVVIGGVGYYLIIGWGIIGAAVTVLIGMLINLILPWIWVLKQKK